MCEFILGSVLLKFPNTHVISIDEKTAIQALQRHQGRASESQGGQKRVEFEYTRHGTTTLIAAQNVETGKLVHRHLGQTRNEEDFAKFVEVVVDELPQMDQVVLLSDQLNTHISATLVEWIAEQEEYEPIEIGVKGKSGFLKNMETRMAFLERSHHRIRFIYTPKHCSWLNPIENWFAKVQRHVIRNGNFSSVSELENKILAYVEFYNRCLAKPLKWKFKGFDKNKNLTNLNME
ncbi:MAG: transposase [Bacteroidota bacterium]